MRSRVRVERLDATLVTEIHRGDLTYEDGCFVARYRFTPDDEPFADFETCAGVGTSIHVVTVDEDYRWTEDDADAALEREQTRQSRGGPVDSFGQPLEPSNELLAERPVSRPIDTPFSVLANFGDGADFPTFVVRDDGTGWRVDPLGTFAESVVEVAEGLPGDAIDDLGRRVHALRGNVIARQALAFEALDPDNLLFGPPAATRLTAACFVELVEVVGEGLALQLYAPCITELLETGEVDPTQIPVAAVLGECYGAPPTSPPALDDPYRRFFGPTSPCATAWPMPSPADGSHRKSARTCPRWPTRTASSPTCPSPPTTPKRTGRPPTPSSRNASSTRSSARVAESLS